MAKRLTAASILKVLDAAAENGDMPAFENLNVDYISSRLTLHVSEAKWSVVFNSVTWMDQCITTVIEPVGNCFSVINSSEIAEQFIASSGIRQSTESFLEAFKERALKGDVAGIAEAYQSMLRGRHPELIQQYNNAYLEAAKRGTSEANKYICSGEVVVDDESGELLSASIRGLEVPLSGLQVVQRNDLQTEAGFWAAVALIERYRADLLASDEEIGVFFPKGLAKPLLVLDEWYHPRICEGGAPSKCETFVMLAAAIVAGDPSLYKPTLMPNTHWSNWLPK